MSKRDDDSSADMEVGMTTAERRRRRRRGGGLRVPSDNVPRRAPTSPPVVAPVPEDPSLAMSIAYSFSGDGSEPVPRVTLETPVPTFSDPVAPEAMQTLIDPPNAPVESVDFEMNTREMSAVDLEALGLETPSSGPSHPRAERVSSPVVDAHPQPARLQPASRPEHPAEDDVDVEMEVDSSGAHDAPDPAPRAGTDSSEPQRAGIPRSQERLRTVALSEEDLEEVREAARQQTGKPVVPADARINKTQPLTALDIEVTTEAKREPLSAPEIDINELSELAVRADSSDDFEVDVEDVPVQSVPSASPSPSPSPSAAAAPPPAPTGDARRRAPTVPPPAPASPAGPAAPVPAAATAPHGSSQATPPALPPQAHAPAKDGPAQPPPAPAQAHKAPPTPPPKSAKPAPARPKHESKAPRGKPWFIELFDEDYLRTLPFLTPQATQSEAEFVIDAMGLQAGAQVLDVGCGYGRHAMELAARGFHVVGLDLSTPLLVRGGEEATRRGLEINFVRGDMRELDFDAQFDGAYCLFSTFGYFDDETNKKALMNIARALKPGGRVMIEILNRDYVIADLPIRVWWEGEGCVVLEEVELNYFSSRIQVNRSVVFDDGRQLEQEISVRAYSLHEVGKLMHAAGFRVIEVSGGYHTRGRFFGNQSRHIIVLAERKDPSAA